MGRFRRQPAWQPNSARGQELSRVARGHAPGSIREQVPFLRTPGGYVTGFISACRRDTSSFCQPLFRGNGYLGKEDNGRLSPTCLTCLPPRHQSSSSEYHHGVNVSDLAPQAWS